MNSLILANIFAIEAVSPYDSLLLVNIFSRDFYIDKRDEKETGHHWHMNLSWPLVILESTDGKIEDHDIVLAEKSVYLWLPSPFYKNLYHGKRR